MPPKSKSRKSEEEVQDAESKCSEPNDSGATKPTINANVRRRSGDISNSTTTEPSSVSATVATSIAEARHPTSLSAILPVATAATAAAPTVSLSGKKRRAGFREQFLKKLRVMLDRESQNDDTTVHWSTDGNSFIVTDQTQFEEEIIPTYFGNPIVFASFLKKLQRWGFVRSSNKRSGLFEFSSPTFKRMDSRSTPAAAAADTNTTANAFENDGGGASIPFPQQQQQQQVMAQLNQHPMHVPNQLPRQTDASAITDLISNIQRQLSTQQPPTSSPQPGPNQVTIQMNLADINNILQNVIGSKQHQPIASQNSLPNQQPMPNHASQLNNVAGNNHLQSFPQWQHPNNPIMNLLNAALQSLGRGPTPPAQTMGQYPVPSTQSNAVHALMSLSRMLSQSPLLNNTPVASDLTPVLSLLQILQRFVDEEHQHRVQVDAMLNAMLVTIGCILGQGFHDNNAAHPQQVGAPPLSRQSLGSNNDNVAQPNELGALHPSIGSNSQADSIAAILQAALTGDATAQPGEYARDQNYGPANNNNNDSEDDIDEDSEENDHHFTKRRKSSPDDEDQWDSDDDDDSWNERLRPRKK